MAVFKDCHQRLAKWWLSLKIVIKDCRSDGFFSLCFLSVFSFVSVSVFVCVCVCFSVFLCLRFYVFVPVWFCLFVCVCFCHCVCARPFLCVVSVFLCVFPKATAKGSFEKSTTIKDCRSDPCLERLSSKTTEVMAVCKDCHRRLEKRLLKWCLSWKTVIKDYRSDGCL